MIKKLLLSVLLFLSVLTLLAERRKYFVTHFGTEQGMASDQIFTLFRDDSGYLWIGTVNGLQRFDGRSFMTYQIKSPELQPSKPVMEILKDLEGTLWLKVGDDYGYYQPELELFTPIPFEKEENRFLGEQLWMDSKGNLFVILTNTKLLWIDQKNNRITDQNLPVQIPDGWRPRSLFEDKNGLYWISCVEGVAVFDPSTSEIFTHQNNPRNLEVLKNQDLGHVINTIIDSKGIFWINYWAPNEKLVSYNPQTNTWKEHQQDLANTNSNYQEIFGSLELPNGELWRYGVQAFAKLNREAHRFEVFEQSSVKYDLISKLVYDPSGGLWAGTDRGLYFLHFDTPSMYFMELSTENGNYEFQALEEVIYQGDTTFWLGSWGKGIQIFKSGFQTVNLPWLYTTSPGTIESKQVWDIHFDPKRSLVWVGLQKGLLQIIDLQTNTSKFIKPPLFENSTILTITQMENGDLWFGTQSGRVLRYRREGLDENGFEIVRRFDAHVPKIIVSQDQKIWVTTSDEGVYMLDPETGDINRHLDKNQLSSNKMEGILQVNDSLFMMGFELLNKYNVNTGENEVFSYSNGLLSNNIFDMEVDKEGMVWVYTPNGLTRFDPISNTFTSFGKNHIFSHLPKDGRTGKRFSNGQLAFVSSNGMIIFDPLQFDKNLPPLTPTITNVELFGVYVGDGTSENPLQSFKSHQNSLNFDFNILNFSLQDRFRYQYRLVGADPDWVEAKGEFRAVYSLLPPGEYRFEVRSYNESGVFSEAASYPFEIKPSLIQTWWFKALMGLLFLSIILLIYKMNVNRILAVVKLRSRLARDLHDDMGSTLSTINILSSMAKTKIGTDPAKSSEYISKISENSQRMMESMDDIVWSIKPQNDTMEKLIARMREFANQVLESKGIEFSMEINEKVLGMKLSMDARRDLFLIFKEGINNAAKYSKAERVLILFSLDKTSFTMQIKDNGKGFDSENNHEGNGLQNMKKRAASLEGTMYIYSKPGKGTELILTIPL
ncbi:sensor histidine kinase [Algoriphagus sp. CAU 1675]|uniref:sensor histidine kinase n=1 Tax=Algoriphagus sp. CAU 1675 TaxID=3032597 RepID=UPI0023DBA78E|nr:sensor histidine kinase [Algoriphagus sp. CAU 1675]MDF2157048.1 triple tyrosine motif-containing protein [Algoriphagus sp. CAU 1675]